ncbi:Importin subunit beta-1 [Dermatophagoides pteronyssinus]|uniref:Importin subunit beta-1 n=1 Tax=Dermatophagoides pteronyssinus TaxID=6956 RepID=A0ABQ8JN48_DERPT|nr:Importin subunit beta-1 [Dermatophagoides pteronyssinus]
MSILPILEKAISQDQNEIRQAYELLEQFCRSNLPEYLKSLSEVLVNKEINGYVRMLAGLQLKNQLTSKDETERTRLQQQWLSLPKEIRDQIKINVMNSLGTETGRPSSSSQCIAYIAAIELRHNLWPDLIKLLTDNATRPDVNEQTKVATLETIGYIRQEVNPALLVGQSNEMLTAIVNNMRKDEQSNAIKLTATTALLNSLDYIKANFDTENERHYIMQVVCEATQCQDVNVQVAALQCLVKIMSLFYQHMEHYMRVALFPITMQAIKSTHPDICLQGIEFWSNVCEEEIELQYEAVEAQEQGRPPQRTSKFYAKGALQFLVPSLLKILTQQEEDSDEDEWNPCKAASVCLALLANCTGDDIPPIVLPFIVSKINSPDWHYREAAMMALGSILEGPSQNQLIPIVTEALPTVINLTHDSSVCVRDTTMWVLSVICQQVSEVIFKPDVLKLVLDVFIEGLKSEPRVAVHSCLAFNSLSESANDIACNAEGVDENPRSNALSEYFQYIINHLLQCTERPDALMNNLRSSAYEAIMEMIKNSPQNCYEIVRQTTMIILDRLNRSFISLENTGNMDQNLLELQSLLCSALQSVLRKMIPEDGPKISDAIMTAMIHILEYSSKTGNVSEDALLVAGTLAEVLEKGFLNYLPTFKNYLFLGLKSYQNSQLCSISIGIVSDLCHSLKNDIAQFSDELIVVLIEVLQSNLIPRVKSEVLKVFGDIALAIGFEFEKYLNHVLQTLVDAVNTSVQQMPTTNSCNHINYELVEYLNDLWESILLAYTGIVQALKGDEDRPHPKCIQVLQPHILLINQFLITLASRWEELPDCIISSAAGLIGDLVNVFGADMLTLCELPQIQQMFARGKRSKSSKVRGTIGFAVREIKRVKTQLQTLQQGGQQTLNQTAAEQQMFGNAQMQHNTATASCNGIFDVDNNENVSTTITSMIPRVLQMKHFDHDYCCVDKK